MVSFMPDARRVSLITRTVSCSGVRAPTRSRPPGSVGGMRSMPHRRSTSSYRSISRSRSGRKVGGSTESTEASSVASTAQPRRTRMSSMKSAGMSAPIMATKRGMRKMSSGRAVGSSYTSTTPGRTVPPDTSARSAAAACDTTSHRWSSTPRS